MDDIEELLAAFERGRVTLEADRVGKWAVFRREAIEVFDSFQGAVEHAIPLPPPYLLKQIGAIVTGQGSVLYEGPNANGESQGARSDPQELRLEGARIGLEIGFTQASPVRGPFVARLPDRTLFQAIIDTGGHHSVVDEDLARRAGLPCVNRANVVTATGTREQNVYLGQLYFPGFDWFVIEQMVGASLGAGHPVIHLGRPFLSHIKLFYKGSAGYSLGRG